MPAAEDDVAYISSGTWSLVGLELSEPVLTEEARAADFTNEGGVDGTVRFLKNVMGLWVLSECVRAWDEQGMAGIDLPTLLAGAARGHAAATVVDIDDPRCSRPSTATDPMPDRVVALATAVPASPCPSTASPLVRCILDSLALAYRRHLRTAARLAGREPARGPRGRRRAQNALLCQLTADACGLPVLAGPSEATALGNVLVQARALGADLPDLAAMRDLVRRTHDLVTYTPQPGPDWDAAEARVSTPRLTTPRGHWSHEGRPDGHLRQRRDVPRHRQGGRALLRRLGVDVEFPQAQTCCAQPMVNTGYLDEAVPVVRTFVDAFAGYDAIVTPTGSCAGSARHQHSIVARRSGSAGARRRRRARPRPRSTS